MAVSKPIEITVSCGKDGFDSKSIADIIASTVLKKILANTENTADKIGRAMVTDYNSNAIKSQVEQAMLINEEKKGNEPQVIKLTLPTEASYNVNGNKIEMLVSAKNALDANVILSQSSGTGKAPNDDVLKRFNVAKATAKNGLSKWYMNPTNSILKVGQSITRTFGNFIKR